MQVNSGIRQNQTYRELVKLSLAATIMLLLLSGAALAQTSLIRNLKAGKPQVLVVYGTSLSSAPGGKAWVDSVTNNLNLKYADKLCTYNSGRSGKWSTWAVQLLEDSVIKKNPDAVLIEFGINDAFLEYKTSVDVARLNLEFMINRIRLQNSKCEVILQIMNMPVAVHAERRPNLNAYYQMYRETAKKFKLLLIDHYPIWQEILNKGTDNFYKYVPDGIHPSIEASKNITAPFVLKKLEAGK